MTGGQRLAPLAAAPLVILLDRATKHAIEKHVSAWDNLVVIPNLFSIVHTQNRGAAFSMLADASDAWRSVFLIGVSSAVMMFVAVMLWQSIRAPEAHSGLLRYGLSLVLGGAVGNLYDRILAGSVTDFLLFYYGQWQFPVFNIADSAITIGAGLLIVDMLRPQRSFKHVS
jgi:signal peptidase II